MDDKSSFCQNGLKILAYWPPQSPDIKILETSYNNLKLNVGRKNLKYGELWIFVEKFRKTLLEEPDAGASINQFQDDNARLSEKKISAQYFELFR